MGRQEKGWGGKRLIWDVVHLHVVRSSQSITNVDLRELQKRGKVLDDFILLVDNK